MFNLIRNTNDIFDDLFTNFNRKYTGDIMKTDIKENDKEFIFLIDLPGFKKEDIKLSLLDGILTIEVERLNEVEEEKESYIRKERSYGKYSRTFKVGHVDQSNIDAKFEDGLLTLSIPKSEKEQRKYLDIK